MLSNRRSTPRTSIHHRERRPVCARGPHHATLRGSWKTRRIVALGTAAALATALLLPAAPAVAHGQIVDASPSNGSTVSTQLTEIRITFDEAPLAGFENAHRIRVISPSGLDVSTGADRIEDAELVKAVQPDRTGQYTVRWSAVSEDTHPVSGRYTFTYTGPVAPAPSGATKAVPETAASSSPLLPFIVTISATAVLAGATVLVVLLLSRRRQARR